VWLQLARRKGRARSGAPAPPAPAFLVIIAIAALNRRDFSKSFGLVPSGRKNRLVRFSRSLSQRFTMRFSPHTLGNLIHRTRLKLAASMLHFQEYGDFADYFGSRWHYYLGAIIAAIPVPLVFGKSEGSNRSFVHSVPCFAETDCLMNPRRAGKWIFRAQLRPASKSKCQFSLFKLIEN